MDTQPSATRVSICSLLDDARRELLASFQGLSGDEMEAPFSDGWSVKDILAHVAMWDEMVLPDLIRAVRGHHTSLDEWDHESFTDQWNRIALALRRRFPLEQVLGELAESREAVLSFLNSAPEERLSSGPIPVSCAIQAEHDREHAAQIRDWCQREGV